MQDQERLAKTKQIALRYKNYKEFIGANKILAKDVVRQGFEEKIQALYGRNATELSLDDVIGIAKSVSGRSMLAEEYPAVFAYAQHNSLFGELSQYFGMDTSNDSLWCLPKIEEDRLVEWQVMGGSREAVSSLITLDGPVELRLKELLTDKFYEFVDPFLAQKSGGVEITFKGYSDEICAVLTTLPLNQAYIFKLYEADATYIGKMDNGSVFSYLDSLPNILQYLR